MRTRFARPARLVTAVAVPFVFAAALPVADGVSYEFVMKTQSKQTGDKEAVTLRGRGVYAGDDAKIEIVEAASSTGGSEAFGGQGSYFIVKNGGQEMLLVDPRQKQYMKWDIATMFAGMSKVLNAVGGLVKLEMSEIRIDAQDMGAGEPVHGYPTKHIRMVQNYTMSARMFGRTSKSRNETTTDYYFAPRLRIANPFVSNSQQMAMLSQMDMFNNPDYKNQLAAANAKLPKTGVPLRTVTTTVTTDEKGKQETIVSTMEMLNFKSSNVPASTFAIPADYQMVQMTAPGTTAQGDGATGADSASAARPASAADAAKKKLKGIFKR